ncbi:MAG TPA: hypothetical protein VG346_09515 [Acidimicrobiales bacterium]|jgi:hypothetical protein|nr:hypothetical protein [Acidimicrobiales bacterium]
MSRWSAYRWWTHAHGQGAVVAFAAFTCVTISAALIAGPASASAGTPGTVVKVTPSRGLVNGRTVTISGHGLTRSDGGGSLTWFATECTASVRGRMNPSTDTPHCDVTDAQAIRVSRNGSFSMKFRVRSGIIGDGYCGTGGHTTCVIGIGTVNGQGTVVRISFAAPPSPGPTTTTTAH